MEQMNDERGTGGHRGITASLIVIDYPMKPSTGKQQTSRIDAHSRSSTTALVHMHTRGMHATNTHDEYQCDPTSAWRTFVAIDAHSTRCRSLSLVFFRTEAALGFVASLAPESAAK